MTRYITKEVPIKELEDGRHFISDHEVKADPAVADFVDRYKGYYQRDEIWCGWVSPTVEGFIAGGLIEDKREP